MFEKCLINLTVLLQVIVVLHGATLNKKTEEQDIFQQFKRGSRRMLKTAFMKTDAYLMATLNASHFNITVAQIMIKENLVWRERNNLDNIFSEKFEDMQKNFPFSLEFRQSKVCKIEISQSKLSELFRTAGGRDKFLRYLTMIMEGMTNEVLESYNQEYRATPWTIIANSETYTQNRNGCQVCLFVWMNLVYMAEKYYTGMMKEIVIFEAPSQVAKLAADLECFMPSVSNVNVTLFGGKQKYQMGKNKVSQLGTEQFTADHNSNGKKKIKNSISMLT